MGGRRQCILASSMLILAACGDHPSAPVVPPAPATHTEYRLRYGLLSWSNGGKDIDSTRERACVDAEPGWVFSTDYAPLLEIGNSLWGTLETTGPEINPERTEVCFPFHAGKLLPNVAPRLLARARAVEERTVPGPAPVLAPGAQPEEQKVEPMDKAILSWGAGDHEGAPVTSCADVTPELSDQGWHIKVDGRAIIQSGKTAFTNGAKILSESVTPVWYCATFASEPPDVDQHKLFKVAAEAVATITRP